MKNKLPAALGSEAGTTQEIKLMETLTKKLQEEELSYFIGTIRY